MKTDAILISSVPNIIFYTGYSGFFESDREAFLIVKGKSKILITDSRYIEDVNKIKNIKVIECSVGRFLKQAGEKILKDLGIKTLGIEENNLTVTEYKYLSNFTNLVPVDLRDLRIIKDDHEIQNIKRACKIGDDAFDFIVNQLHAGKTEKQVALELEHFIRSKGAEISFSSIVAFGANSAAAHHKSDNTKLKKNEMVLLDFGVKVNNYCSDMSRTVFFGKADNKFKDIYQVVLEAQLKSIKTIKSNINASEIDLAARNHIVKKGFQDIYHSVGHGIGIEVHEAPYISPYSKDIVKNGMVFSVEPGIYIPGYGGVRIEDIVAVRNSKAELISKAKREIIEVNV
jgi:Xaa-Pro aminopeptidase